MAYSGVTWNSVGTLQGVRAVHFVDPTHGWAVGTGGQIWVTSNGGVYWNPQTSGTSVDLHSVYFLDQMEGYAAGGNGFTAGRTEDECPTLTCVRSQFRQPEQILLHTKDRGVTWTVVFDSTGEVPLLKVVFKDKLHGWVAGGTEYRVSYWNSSVSPAHPQVPHGVIKATEDGGVSWKVQADTFYPVYDLWLLDLNNGYAVGSDSGDRYDSTTNRYASGTPRSWILHTTKGGRP
jgi:photosystem II stability/assembly factor-like uncharacterized protein